MSTEKEQNHLEYVLTLLEEALRRTNAQLQLNEQDIARMQEYYWKNYNEFDEYGYEDYDNRQSLIAALDSKSEQTKEQRLYRKMMQSPYFGRVDFRYEDEEEEETYYIGIGNFSPDYTKPPVILDWRAPVSGLFYDFDKGPAYFDAPGGRMEGEITRKKQYQIKNGRLLYEFESDIKIDDEILKKELSQNADARLKSIVTTIQREQNLIIRNRKSRVLVVQGSAGSGKTSIALHRVAYLLYHNRNRLKASDVLILSPSSVFSDYISRILPELGEENIRESGFDEFCAKQLRAYGEMEDRYDYIERVLKRHEDEEAVRIRHGKAFAQEMNGFVLELESDIVSFRNFRYKKMEINASELADYFYRKFPDIPVLKRMETIGEYLIGQEEAVRGTELDEVETAIVYEKLNRMYRTTDIRVLYEEFLQKNGWEKRSEPGKIAYEDAFPMLYLKYCLEGVGRHRPMKHVVVDEMQDYTYMQYLIMQKVFRCPMTILGDIEQTLTETKEAVLPMLSEIFGKDIHKTILKKSYRSSYEIASFASGLIGQTDIEFYPRHAEEPCLVAVQTPVEMAAEIANQIKNENHFETYGILCRDKAQASRLYDLLKNDITVMLLDKDSDRFVKGAVITTYYLAKGLEFDTVHVPWAKRSEQADGMEKQILYLCATRALHRLTLYECINTGNGEKEE